jgi:hypothetical protein
MTGHRVAHDLRTMAGHHAPQGRDGIRALCGRIVGHLGKQYTFDNVTGRESVTCKDCLRYRRTHSYPTYPTDGRYRK